MAEPLKVMSAPTSSGARTGTAGAPDPTKGGDIYGWAMQQVDLIRAGRLDEIDTVNVADEIESLGNSEKRAIGSNLERVLVHILKWTYQPERRSRSWHLTIEEHRDRVAELFGENPSLVPKRDEIIAKSYRLARTIAARETGLSRTTFPENCPYIWADIMEKRYEIDDGQD